MTICYMVYLQFKYIFMIMKRLIKFNLPDYMYILNVRGTYNPYMSPSISNTSLTGATYMALE